MGSKIMKTIRLALVAVMAMLSACGPAGQELTLQPGDEPPKLDFKLLGQKEPDKALTWANFKNQVVVLDFWATSCPPCIEAIPKMNELVEAFKDKPVRFFSITYEPGHMVRPFLKKYPMQASVGIDNDFAMFRSFTAFGIPMVVLVNKAHRIAAVIHPKYLTTKVIEDVLAGKSPDVKQHEGWKDPAGAEAYFRSLIRKNGS